MNVTSDLKNLSQELTEVAWLFFKQTDPIEITHTHIEQNNIQTHKVTIHYLGQQFVETYDVDLCSVPSSNKRAVTRRGAKMCLYYALKNMTKTSQPWGALTGVRPLSLYRKLFFENPNTAASILQNEYDVTGENIALLKEIYSLQSHLFQNIKKSDVALYIGIPFCSSRCSYCTFFGRIANEKECESYLEVLLKEIQAAANALQKSNRNVYAIYIGGGTPTSIQAPLLEKLFAQIYTSFGTGYELTLEAGRVDTITKEKLQIAKQYHTTRLCINPQTMNDKTLAHINRNHSAEDVIASMTLAKELGFDNINMDLIAGLPLEDATDFKNTLLQIEALAPQSLTVHMLAKKRGSDITQSDFEHTEDQVVENMLAMGKASAKNMHMHPYYLYRQKRMAGNLENIGFSIPGAECLYNIGMMEELSHIIALGVGGISKRLEHGGMIRRIPNPKDVGVYIERQERIFKEKQSFFEVDTAY